MAELNPELSPEEFETLDTTERAFYKEVSTTKKDEKGAEIVLKSYVPNIKGIEDSGNLISSLEHRKKENSALNKKIKELENKLNEVDTVAKKNEQDKALALQRQMEESGQYKELSEVYKRQLEEERETWNKTLKEKEERYHKVVLDKELRSFAVTKGGVDPSKLDDFFDSKKNRFELDSEGNILSKDHPKKGGSLNGFTLEKQFDELLKESPWFAANGRTAGGAPSNRESYDGRVSVIDLSDPSNRILTPDENGLKRMASGMQIFRK